MTRDTGRLTRHCFAEWQAAQNVTSPAKTAKGNLVLFPPPGDHQQRVVDGHAQADERDQELDQVDARARRGAILATFLLLGAVSLAAPVSSRRMAWGAADRHPAG
jgi:hypothetical protein